MLNLTRSLLLNIKPSDQIGLTFPETIDEGYTPIFFPTALEKIRRIFLNQANSPDTQSLLAFQLVKLINSTELVAYLREIDDIRTFNLNSNKFFDTASDTTFDLLKLDKSLSNAGEALEAFKNYCRKILDPKTFFSLDIVYQTNTNPVWRVSSIVTLWILTAVEVHKNLSLAQLNV